MVLFYKKKLYWREREKKSVKTGYISSINHDDVQLRYFTGTFMYSTLAYVYYVCWVKFCTSFPVLQVDQTHSLFFPVLFFFHLEIPNTKTNLAFIERRSTKIRIINTPSMASFNPDVFLLTFIAKQTPVVKF